MKAPGRVRHTMAGSPAGHCQHAEFAKGCPAPIEEAPKDRCRDERGLPGLESAAAGRYHINARALLLPLTLSCLLSVVLQWNGGAYNAEWSGTPDEPAHYVTGLLVHDYVVNGARTDPYSYAKTYYEHYPKVALGHWPPVYYLVQAAWTIPFSASRTSLLLLQAFVTALLAATTYLLALRYFPAWLAWSALVSLSTAPAIQVHGRMVMSQTLVALLSLWAIVLLARYIASPKWRDATGFGLLSSLTILTKGTGLLLAGLPLLSVLAARRAGLLKRLSFWMPALIVVLLCCPWYLLVPGAQHEKVARYGGLAHVYWSRFAGLPIYWTEQWGAAGAVLATVGVLRTAGRLFIRNTLCPFWVIALVTLPVVTVFRMAVGAWEMEHLLTTLPLAVLFLCSGAWWLLSLLPNRRIATAVCAVIVAGAGVWNVKRLSPKRHLGLDAPAKYLIASPARAPILIVSDALGEGVFIAEIAMREKRPGQVIERGTKLLAESEFMGERYRLKFASPSSLMEFLRRSPGRVLVIDAADTAPPHLDLVRETVERFPEEFDVLGRYPRNSVTDAGVRFPSEILVCRVRAISADSRPLKEALP